MQKRIILSAFLFLGLTCFSSPEYKPKPCEKNGLVLNCKKKTAAKKIQQKKKKETGEENIPFQILMYHIKPL